ncbi:hypothetical protein WN944_004199 [Citrus x changshan-huyou]|uniref:Uncharacterized protein n=1 Tax=Citrus x changshan-huyou TaxID=2935761 RepID=A0AAP0LZY2_9ROSI
MVKPEFSFDGGIRRQQTLLTQLAICDNYETEGLFCHYWLNEITGVHEHGSEIFEPLQPKTTAGQSTKAVGFQVDPDH